MTNLLTLTNIIIALTCVISLLSMQNHAGKSALVFHPVTVHKKKQWYRFLTSGFIHADGMHLAINMFVLWSFGNAIETGYYPAVFTESSEMAFLGLYLGGIIVSSIPSYQRHYNNLGYASLGASGGVAAVVFAAIIFAPWQNLYIYGVLPVPQILGGIGFLYYSWYKDQRGNDNIGHMAHLTGALWGFFYTGLLNPKLFTDFLQATMEGPSW